MVENGEVEACKEQHLLVAYVRRCFETQDIYTDDEQLDDYLSLARYFPYERLFEWEVFCLALHDCTYWTKDDMPRWPDLFALMGRGGGKDGYIAYESFCWMSPYNGILKYDIDICANNEDQAKAPFDDIYDILDSPEYRVKLKKHFKWNKEVIRNLKTKSVIKYRTNSPKGKDGLRSGAVIFNEIHQYENYDNINVFTTGLGKKKHPRITYATTNGDIREGPLDDLLEDSLKILDGSEVDDGGLLPFICRLDDEKEVDDPSKWEKANPSLRYLPHLLEEIKKEYKKWKKNPNQFSAFMTKRMNIPSGKKEIEVTCWGNIIATNREIPDLRGRNAVVGIDFAKVTDMVSVDIHFREGDIRYDINHSWLCLSSKDLPRLKCPWREWGNQGLLTLVDDVEINPDIIIDYVGEAMLEYNITKIAVDNFRYALIAEYLRKIGFDANTYKNVKTVRPSDVMTVVPIIDRLFAKQYFTWGDNPVLRWGTNNTKLMKSGVRKKDSQNDDTGNYVYKKQDAKRRKTDPFMAVVAAMTIEEVLGDGIIRETPDVGVFVY